jgi:hypothetical protein
MLSGPSAQIISDKVMAVRVMAEWRREVPSADEMIAVEIHRSENKSVPDLLIL